MSLRDEMLRQELAWILEHAPTPEELRAKLQTAVKSPLLIECAVEASNRTTVYWREAIRDALNRPEPTAEQLRAALSTRTH